MPERARRYDAKNGRFTDSDIIKGNIGHLQSQNEYAYCLGNPLAYMDRDGRESEKPEEEKDEVPKDFEYV